MMGEIKQTDLVMEPYDPYEVEKELAIGSELTDKQERFVDLYMVSFNPIRAAKEAGYSAWVARIAHDRLMKNPKIRAEIDRRKAIDRERDADLNDQIKESLKLIAFGDLTGAFKEDGTVKNVHDIDLETMSQIESLTTKKVGKKVVTTITTPKKIEALKQLAKMQGMYEKNNAQMVESGFGPLLKLLPEDIREELRMVFLKRIKEKGK